MDEDHGHEATRGSLRQWLVLCGCLTAALTWLYWPLLAGQVPAFRDAFHFYFPLYFWLDQQAIDGHYFPQFNPWDGTGLNLVGETSTGLFYPGRLLWFLPYASLASRFGWFLLVHNVLAALGAAYAARRARLGLPAQCLAAIAYGMSAPVVFAHTNPIYLVGAAWIPWALAECWVLSRNSSSSTPRWGVWVVATSLMLLGGDPQATVNTGIIALAALMHSRLLTPAEHRSLAPVLRLGVAVVAVAGLTAIQWLPASYWLSVSGRQTMSTAPTQSGQFDPTATVESAPVPALLQPSLRDHVPSDRYAFSVAPWHLLTMFWGTLGGHYLPEHTRWLTALRAEPRMWTPSLTIGLLGVCLALATLWYKPLRRETRFWWWITLLAGTAMLGNYAPAWMLRHILDWLGMTIPRAAWPSDEVGGTYWLLTKVVPGYSAFRYPAKWSVWFAFSVSLCAAHALNRWPAPYGVLRRSSVLALVVSLAGMPGLVAFHSFDRLRIPVQEWIAAAPHDPWMGPLAGDAGASVVFMLMTQALMVAGIVSVTSLLVMHRMNVRVRPWAICLLMAGELMYTARHWMVTTSPPVAAVALNGAPGPIPSRLWAAAARARFDQPEHGGKRVEQVAIYQQQFVLGKLHLLEPACGNLAAFASLTPTPLAAARRRLARHDRLVPDNAPLDEALAWLGIEYRLVARPELAWQAIGGARPLFELQADDGREHESQNTLHVKQFSSDHWRVRFHASTKTQLVARLFQDGGWRAHALSGSSNTRTLSPRPSHLQLFQTLELPAGRWEIDYRYVAPGLRVGSIISGVSVCALVLFAFVPSSSNLLRGAKRRCTHERGRMVKLP